ncbi:cbb3-type cytochrome c oxidase subunit I [Methyloferula stellata]|uniref:cbb3-type cytochrome c oxidase subunit I n=1 Tax=Methyloferula stellata TaxID=876270 RepID=UPI0003646B36|nr:cbb3-type cytochrome c oxidase subunit I [Methyloferula stellata]
MEGLDVTYRADRLILAHFGIAFAAFVLAIVLGAWQMTVRSGLEPAFTSPEAYFASVTAHGTIMGYVMPTLFIMGFGYFVSVTTLERPLPSMRLAWAGFWLVIVGVLMALPAVFAGKATVLYTFYPPLSGSIFYYLGLVLVVVGSWVWVGLMIWAMAGWKKDNPGKPVPLAMYGNVANAFLWLWTTAGVAVELLFQVIPASLGWTQTIDVGLARTLFAWTLHPIVYFWLLPAYITFYTIAPRAAGGRLYSDMMGRLSFLLLVLYSLPVGMHHLFMDPEHGTGFKFLQMMLTVLVTVPTLLTIFTIGASMEIAGRLRGGKGLFGWIGALPWDRPMVLATGLSFVLLGFGGFGGIINMSYGMNAMIHNTSWVTAHFHLIYGGTVVIMYFAIAYEFWPKLLGREALALKPIRLQLWMWAIGMIVTTFPWHILGLEGQPRRVATFDYTNPMIAYWQHWTIVSMIGGYILLTSGLLFVWNLLTLYRGALADRRMYYAVAVYPPHRVPSALNGFALCNGLVLFLMLMAYGYPIAQFFFIKDYPALVHRVDLGN